MRLRLYRFIEGFGVSTSIRVVGSLMVMIAYLALMALGVLGIIALIYATVWPD
jgi:hypothetical protein